MGIKAKLGLGMATAALGISLVGGGTFAYFTDTAVKTGTFASGYIDLNAGTATSENITFSKLAPGDHMTKSFTLKNDGTVDIASAILHTKYTVTDDNGSLNGHGGTNTADLGRYIKVEFLTNLDKSDNVVLTTNLYDLQNAGPDALENLDVLKFLGFPIEELSGLKVGNTDTFTVRFTFVDEGDQSQFQNDTLNLEWSFEARSKGGKELF
ncbi:TasA family protein [Paenibacillus sp. YAF4_2]|uniref:TasA family protein n=1 Tax=Paenibacillus sp. YAF4_2 TaxID=3233085 RepID=UPI003F967023